MNLLEKALEFIFIPTCGICNKLGEGYLCNRCKKQLEKYTINEIELKEKNNYTKFKYLNKEMVRDKEEQAIEKMHIFWYKEVVRDTILQYKFKDKPYLYRTFCEFIVKNKKALEFIKSYDIIIPVPMYKTKIRKRGYNQSELIAKELAKKLGMQMENDVIIKIRDNKIQSTLNKQERQENIKNAYKLINPNKIENKKVLIFDDIYTTGATLNECVKVVESGNASKIGILTLAKD